jgi:hypothetical protein
MHRVFGSLAAGLVAGFAFAATAAMAEPSDLKDLAKNPQEYLDQEVEIVGFCVKGGRSGDVLGYECTTDAGIYVDADEIEPETAKETFGDCGLSQDDACRATIQFVPHSFTTSGVIEPGKSVIVFNSKNAKISF